MDLLDRYLQAVKGWLPEGQDQDIVAELEADLRAQIDEQGERLGHPLDAAETAAILKRCGDPLTVAGRLLAKPALLDPVWSLLYRFVLKVVLLWILLPVLAVTLLPGVVLAEHPVLALLAALSRAWQACVYAIGMITLGFAVVLYYRGIDRWRAAWDPLRLPRLRSVRNSRRIPRAGSIVEIVVDTLFLLWWVGFPAAPFALSIDASGVHWAVSAIWTDFHARCLWAVAALATLHLALAVANLVRPYWSRVRLGWRAGLNAGMSGVLILGVRAGLDRFHVALSALQAPPPLTGTALAPPITEVTVWVALLVGAGITAVTAVVDLVRLLRLPPEERD